MLAALLWDSCNRSDDRQWKRIQDLQVRVQHPYMGGTSLACSSKVVRWPHPLRQCAQALGSSY
jgi:hypothetical protein